MSRYVVLLVLTIGAVSCSSANFVLITEDPIRDLGPFRSGIYPSNVPPPRWDKLYIASEMLNSEFHEFVSHLSDRLRDRGIPLSDAVEGAEVTMRLTASSDFTLRLIESADSCTTIRTKSYRYRNTGTRVDSVDTIVNPCIETSFAKEPKDGAVLILLEVWPVHSGIVNEDSLIWSARIATTEEVLKNFPAVAAARTAGVYGEYLILEDNIWAPKTTRP